MPVLFRPNPSLGVPAYLQLRDQFKHALQTGALQPGEALPAVPPLARELVISPAAVARAYKALQDEGFIQFDSDAGALRAVQRPPGAVTVVGSPTATRVPGAVAFSELAAENRRLCAEIACHTAERLRSAREIEIAHDVQQRLLPRACGVLPGLEYAGVSRAAQGLGGDYYDFVQLSATTSGLAVGDVSGKGTPAALLMAMLRGYWRAQAIRGETDLAGGAADLNRLVYEGSAADRYATFFSGRYDASTRRLDYVNAGHLPPFVFRRRSDRHEVLRANPTGPVVGLLDACVYAQEHVALEAGDLFVAVTDGVTEAMNEGGEEWGEERLD